MMPEVRHGVVIDCGRGDAGHSAWDPTPINRIPDPCDAAVEVADVDARDGLWPAVANFYEHGSYCLHLIHRDGAPVLPGAPALPVVKFVLVMCVGIHHWC